MAGKITYERGTTQNYTFNYSKDGVPSTDGQKLFFTVKADQYDSSDDDSTAIIKKDIPMSGASTSFTIDPSDIADTMEPGKYYYDFKVKELSEAIYSGGSGQFILTANPTNRES